MVVNQRILELPQGKQLFVNNFSWQMLKGAKDKLFVTEHFLDIAKEGDFCFVENQPLLPYKSKIESIYIFKWNRDYPCDFKLDIDLSEWKCTYFEEFSGSSHECIYFEQYEKVKEN